MSDAHLAVRIVIPNILIQMFLSDDGQIGRATLRPGHLFVRCFKF